MRHISPPGGPPGARRPWNPLLDPCLHAGAGGGCPVCLEDRLLVAAPTTHRILRRATVFLVEATRAEAREARAGHCFAELTWISDLMPPTRAAAHSAAVFGEFAGALQSAVQRLLQLAGGRAARVEPPLSSTGEQLAALGILGVGDAMAADAPEWGVREPAAALGRARADLQVLRAIALDDADALLLFDPALDGIERSPAADRLGLDALADAAWFRR